MSLNDRWIGSELSVVERELACNKKYSNVGYVIYHTKKGDYFYLKPSPFLTAPRNEVYHTSNLPPPERTFVEVEVSDEKWVGLDKPEDDRRLIREITNWKPFDPTPLARRRKLWDFREILEFFTYPFKGESESVEEIAGCSTLFAFSCPPLENEAGGIKSAVFGKEHQWNLFKRPLNIIPQEFLKANSDYFYYISNNDRGFDKLKGEVNLAIHSPDQLITDIPIAILNESERKPSRDSRENTEIAARIVRAHLLDALLLKPEPSQKVEKLMLDSIYRLRDEYYSDGVIKFHQNVGDAVQKLASAYARLQSSPDIKNDDVEFVTELWSRMRKRTLKLQSSPMKPDHMLELTSEARIVYFKLWDVFGADYPISIYEAKKCLPKLDPRDFELAIDSLVAKGYCIRRNEIVTILEPYKK